MNEKKQQKSTSKSSKTTDRTRNFAFIVYPDSAPKNWREILSETHVEALISPLHDKDVNPDNTPKKPHYHVMIMFSSVKTLAQAEAIRDSLGGVGWENIASARGYARYLCHLDNPEKAMYDKNDVVEMGGADYEEIIRRAADGVKAIGDMIRYIEENDVIYYSDFLLYCQNERMDWFDLIITRYTYTVYTFIKARGYKDKTENEKHLQFKIKKEYNNDINLDTGEIID